MSANIPENPFTKPVPPAEPTPSSAPPYAPPAPFGQPAQQAPYGQPAQQAPHAQQVPPYAQPAPYGQQPDGMPGAPFVVDPGKTLSIVAIILPFVGFSLVGLILGLVAMSKSKKAGFKNTLALVAVIISALAVVATIIAVILFFVWANSIDPAAVLLIQQVTDACRSGAETVTVDGLLYSCSAVG
ncbi:MULTISPECIES: hypothetical protein [Arthrobacter]|uniref:hypothetical protein n=1 Tax=Arthrobacter TaxID=1663 RepID=UPI0007866D1F|nr:MULTISPECIES: hypothetical protein [Arthrobacter]